MIDTNKIKCENSLEDLKNYNDYFFDIIYSDPPYNLASDWFIDDDGKYKLKKKQRDFLNKWDGLDEDDLDLFFSEAYRTLKHGGYCILFGMDRQLSPFQYYAVKNGFEIHQSLYWFFMSNFPKASDVSKMIDKKLGKDREVIGRKIQRVDGTLRNVKHQGGFMKENIITSKGDGYIDVEEPASDQAKLFDGYKYGKAPLKQCLETVMVYHKPCKSKTIIDDIIECSSGIHPSCVNIDGERVEYVDEKDIPSKMNRNDRAFYSSPSGYPGEYISNDKGRHPSQLLVDDDCAKVIDEQTGNMNSGHWPDSKTTGYGEFGGGSNEYKGVGPKDNSKSGGSKILHKCNYTDEERDMIHPSCVNIDGERVEYLNEKDMKHLEIDKYDGGGLSLFSGIKENTKMYGNKSGRHPSQLLVDDDCANVIDEQTGIKKSNPQFHPTTNLDQGSLWFNKECSDRNYNYTDTGGGSKILHKCKYEEGEMDLIKYSPKVSKKERNEGCDNFEGVKRKWVRPGGGLEDDPRWESKPQSNPHPTLKPISLNKHILNLFYTPNNPRIYIPFSGAGSEIIPALQLGYDVYSSELSEEYYDIQLSRIEHHLKKESK